MTEPSDVPLRDENPVPEPHPRFDTALAALDAGDLARLEALLRHHPELVHARASSSEPPYDGYFWRATLLHHVAGNPVRRELPPNVVAVAAALLRAGADPDAECGGGPSQPESAGATTLHLVASGAQAWRQGLTEGLIDALLRGGASLDPDGNGGVLWTALYHTVENRGQREVAALIHERGHGVDLCYAAGLGREELTLPFLGSGNEAPYPDADHYYRHHRRGERPATGQEILDDALLFASATGHVSMVELLAERGARVDAVRPWGPETVAPLHAAAWAGWPSVVRWLVEHGADPNLRDPKHGGTARDWAGHCRRSAVLEVFRDIERRSGGAA